MTIPSLPRGLYAIADSGFGDPVELGQRLFDAGCRVVQLRAKAWSDTQVERAARALLARCGDAMLVVNDRMEVAKQVGAHGVHLGQDDGPADAPPGMLVGRSTHDLHQVRVATDAHYLGFGPVFATWKGDLLPLGTEELARAVAATHLPVVAIGGVRAANLAEVRATGAHGWAAISELLTAQDLIQAVRGLSE